MAKAEFSQAIFIHANPARVKALLFDYSQHTRLHPMIVSVRKLEPAKTADGRPLRRHRITDRMRMGPLTFRFTYYATIFEDAQGDLVGDAYQNPGVHLRVITRCQPNDQGTRVDEHVTVEAPRLLLGTTLRQARKAHENLLARLKAFLEA